MANNPTEYYASLSELSVTTGGKSIPVVDKNAMVPAKGEMRYAAPAGVSGKSGVLNYSTINDFGGETPVLHQSLSF